MKAKRETIDRFFSAKQIAVAGVSRDPKKFGQAVMKTLHERGYEVFPVNPSATEIAGTACYSSITALPAGIKKILVVTPKNETLGVVKEAVARDFDTIWIQQMSETPETLDYLKDKNVDLIAKECVLMFAEPVSSFHKFHRTIKRIFGALPR
jgi:uncharacterized protein